MVDSYWAHLWQEPICYTFYENENLGASDLCETLTCLVLAMLCFPLAAFRQRLVPIDLTCSKCGIFMKI